jgi:hypothetical protein
MDLKVLLVSLLDFVNKLKTGAPASTPVRDDPAAEEMAVNGAKDTIRAANREIIDLSTSKFSLQSASSVLEVNSVCGAGGLLCVVCRRSSPYRYLFHSSC